MHAVLRREKGVSLYRDGLADEEKGHDENSAGFEEASKTVGARAAGSSTVDTGPMGDVRSQLHAKWEGGREETAKEVEITFKFHSNYERTFCLFVVLEQHNWISAWRINCQKTKR